MPADADSPRTGRIRRRAFLGGSAAVAGTVSLGSGSAIADTGGTALGAPARGRDLAGARRRTRIGIGYETWFDAVGWGRTEAVPVLGRYSSTDPKVIRQHAKWITYTGIDHILIDWSNNLGANWENGTAKKIIAGTDVLLKEYAQLRDRPDVTLLLGLDGGEAGTAQFEEQIAQIKKNYLEDPSFRRMFVAHDGKPLLSIYTGARTTPPPEWDDPAFTIRWMGAFREIVLNPGGVWSWVDRQAYANGELTPEADFAGSGLAGWTADPAWKVGKVKTGPAFDQVVEVLCANTQPADGADQQKGALTSPPFTITQRVLSFNAIGVDMSAGSDLGAADSRNLFLLKDAESGAILRHVVPPGDPSGFHVRQWQVADLVGRRVVFSAVNNSTFAAPLGWMGFDGLWQQRCEQMTAVVSNGGNQAPGAYTNWDAHLRASGAYLVEMMQTAYEYEPEFLLIQQWNEFGRPDQYGVVGSNDIEPTAVTKLAGADSDGWGFYYLKLVRDLVDQYRAGAPFPRVQLDTRYP